MPRVAALAMTLIAALPFLLYAVQSRLAAAAPPVATRA